MTVFFALIMGAMALGQAGPNVAAFAVGRGAAVGVFAVLDRESRIDALSEAGLRPAALQGRLAFRNVRFAYPSRPTETILLNLELDIAANTTVALVGESGCGKSTIMALLARHYDPLEGTITLDGVDIRELNVQWLRAQCALVSQQPVLFPTTVYMNIACGKENATEADVIAAAKKVTPSPQLPPPPQTPRPAAPPLPLGMRRPLTTAGYPVQRARLYHVVPERLPNAGGRPGLADQRRAEAAAGHCAVTKNWRRGMGF
jgi:ABC-type multidrug transport system fused ATPase/permease subunit